MSLNFDLFVSEAHIPSSHAEVILVVGRRFMARCLQTAHLSSRPPNVIIPLWGIMAVERLTETVRYGLYRVRCLLHNQHIHWKIAINRSNS